jgi:hypothetical protein
VFQLKAPDSLRVEIKGARGLSGDAYAMRPGIFEIAAPALMLGYTPLKAGEETAVLVTLSDLPANADVKTLSASLHVLDDDSAVEAEKTTVAVKRDKEPETKFQTSADPLTRPRNVELRLDKGDVFWSFGGTLVKESYDLPDFAEQVNAYLDKVKPAGDQLALKFLVKSDTKGQVKISIADKSLSRLQTQTWKNPLDETIRLDRNLQLDFGLYEEIVLDEISPQAGIKTSFSAIKMDVGGTLGAERLLGTVEEHNGCEFGTISSDYSLAQSFILDTPIQCVGVTSLFTSEAEAELYVELQNDLNGSPASEAPLAKSNLTLPGGEKNGKTPWTFAALENPTALSAAVRYWIVLKGVRGKTQLGLQAQTDGTYLEKVLVNRGGQLWKGFDALTNARSVALLRLIYLPELDNQSAAVQIGINETHWRAFDPAAESTTLSFELNDASIRQAVIAIKSHARGVLTVANVIQEY